MLARATRSTPVAATARAAATVAIAARRAGPCFARRASEGRRAVRFAESFGAGLRRFRQAGHRRRVDNHVALRTPSVAFAPDRRIVAQCNMDHTALAAVHRVEFEILPGAMDLFR